MTPTDIILWIGVVVFGATALIAILYLAGIIKGPYDKLLIGTLVTQVVVVCVAVFAEKIRESKPANIMPVDKLAVIENATVPTVAFDEKFPIYIRSPNVSRANKYALLEVSTNQNFVPGNKFKLEKGTRHTFTLDERSYEIDFVESGQLDPSNNLAPALDYATLAIRRSR